MRAALLLTLAAIAACTRQPSPPAPVPVLGPEPTAIPSPAPASPTPGPLFCLHLGQPQPDTDYLLAVLAASDAWESATHRRLFSWSEGRPVQLMQFAAIDAGDLGDSKITGGITFTGRGLVAFSAQVPLPLRPAVVLHELGHVIGLHHVDDPTSVMFPTSSTQSITPDDAFRAIAALDAQEDP